MRVRRPLVVSLLLGAALCGTVAAPVAAQAPPNDDFADATVISSLPFLDTLDTTAATTEPVDFEALAACGVSVPIAASVWYALTPSTDRVVSVDTFGSTYTSGVAVVTGSPGNLSAVTCFSVIGRFTPVPGQTYYIGVSDISGSGGGTLNVSVTAPELTGTVDKLGRIDPITGEVTLTGTITCTANLSGDVLATLTQRRGQTAVRGSGATTLICNGREQSWSITLQPTAGSFKNGRATVAAEVVEHGATSVSERFEEKVVLHSR